MLTLCTIATLGFLSVGTAGPLACESVLKLLDFDDLSPLWGKWYSIGVAVPHKRYQGAVENSSFWLNVSPTSSNNTLNYYHAVFTFNECDYITGNITNVNGTFTTVPDNKTEVAQYVFYQTCSDCLLFQYVIKSDEDMNMLLFLAKTRELNDKERAEFRKQASCSGFPTVVFLTEKSLCPAIEEPPPEGSDITKKMKQL